MSTKKQRFSQIDLRGALQIIGINELKEWQPEFSPKLPSDYYLMSTQKLKAHFDLSLSESAKSLLIDAIDVPESCCVTLIICIVPVELEDANITL